MEKFDVVDINGKPSGLLANRGTLLNNGQYYIGVHVYIYNSRMEFLLQQRSYTKEFRPGGWDILMGHNIAGETSYESIIREIKEEIGLIIPQKNIEFISRIIWEEYHHIMDVFFLKIDYNLKKLILKKDEVINIKKIIKQEMLVLIKNMDYRPREYREIIGNEILKRN